MAMLFSLSSFGIEIALFGKVAVPITALAEAPVQIIPAEWKIEFSHNVGNVCDWFTVNEWDLANKTAPLSESRIHTWAFDFHRGFFANNVYGDHYYCHHAHPEELFEKALILREKRLTRPYALVEKYADVIYAFSTDGQWIANASQKGHTAKLFYAPWGKKAQADLVLDKEIDGGVISMAFMECGDEIFLVVFAELKTNVHRIVKPS